MPVVVPDEGAGVAITIDLERGGVIEGRLLQMDGSPPQGFYVLATTPADPDGSEHWDRTAQVTGRFRIEGLPDGTYRVFARRDAGTRFWYPGTYVMEEALPITVERHAVVDGIDWSLPY
jgi:hypothetical protein